MFLVRNVLSSLLLYIYSRMPLDCFNNCFLISWSKKSDEI